MLVVDRQQIEVLVHRKAEDEKVDHDAVGKGRVFKKRKVDEFITAIHFAEDIEQKGDEGDQKQKTDEAAVKPAILLAFGEHHQQRDGRDRQKKEAYEVKPEFGEKTLFGQIDKPRRD